MTVQNTVRKSFECAAMNVDSILIKSVSAFFAHNPNVFSGCFTYSLVCSRVSWSSCARCTQTWNVCRTISIFVIDAACGLIRYTAIIGKINSHRKVSGQMEEEKKRSKRKTKSHTHRFIQSNPQFVLCYVSLIFGSFFHIVWPCVFYRCVCVCVCSLCIFFLSKLIVVKLFGMKCEKLVFCLWHMRALDYE